MIGQSNYIMNGKNKHHFMVKEPMLIVKRNAMAAA
jgi:hypothetical protein